MNAPVVAICGFPRSGSSLVMQMLAAGGFPCVGEFPAFEEYRPAPGWPGYAQLAGRAVKLLDSMLPFGPTPKDIPQSFILMVRDHREQAKSFAKFYQAAAGEKLTRGQIRDIADSFKQDEPRLMGTLRELGPVLLVNFERLLRQPLQAAARLEFHLGRTLDLKAMAAAVVPRGSKCLDGLLELDQLDRALGPSR